MNNNTPRNFSTLKVITGMLKFIGMRLAGQVSHMDERNHTCEVWTGKINLKSIQELIECYY
jgi:hypothetical protein